MIDIIFFLVVFCLGAAASYFLLKGFYDNAQRYESMAGELREKSGKLLEYETELARLEEENKHLRSQGEKILAENNDLKDVNGSNSRYSYLIANAAEKANELLKILDVDETFSKKIEKKPQISKIETDQNITQQIENFPRSKIIIEKDAYIETKPQNTIQNNSGKRF